MPDDRAESAQEFTCAVAETLTRTAGDVLMGVYLHGSAVLGDWTAGASDVDVLVIVADDPSKESADRMANALGAELTCPGIGLEASVVTAAAAAHPRAPWPFVVHVTTAPEDFKTVRGRPGHGDPDLILHYAVARARGWAALGPEPQTLIGAVPDDVVLNQLTRELRWAIEHADATYAVLNACRALRFRDERVLCAKTAGGDWALERRIAPALVQRAIDDRRLGASRPLDPATVEWVMSVAADLET